MSCVYCHINKINKKKYIGFSKYDDPSVRWGFNGSGYEKQKFYKEGIIPFGWNNFTHLILIKEIPISLARTLEYYLIKELNTIQDGYNEDEGFVAENDKNIALTMVPNFISQINNNSFDTKLQTLDDVIDIKYTAVTVNYRLEYLFDLFQKNRLNTSLDCQREYVWDETRQQGMWDTLLYGHRIPEMHAVRRSNGTYDIIDGKQRLLTLMKILNDEIPLQRKLASAEIREYLINNNIASIKFSELSDSLKTKIYNKELSVAEYSNVDEEMLVVLFQKLNAGKALSEFQKCIANNIIVRTRYTQFFEEDSFVKDLFSQAELSSNEDEVMLIRCLSSLNCGKIDNIDGLEQRNLSKIIERMDVKTLTFTRTVLKQMFQEFQMLGITGNDIKIINKTWYPLLLKFYNEEIPSHLKQHFKSFLPYIQIPSQRGQESSKTQCKIRYRSILNDWNSFCQKNQLF